MDVGLGVILKDRSFFHKTHEFDEECLETQVFIWQWRKILRNLRRSSQQENSSMSNFWFWQTLYDLTTAHGLVWFEYFLCILFQKQEEVERFIGFWGRNCNRYERHYPSMKEELLALVKSMEGWKHILKYRPPLQTHPA